MSGKTLKREGYDVLWNSETEKNNSQSSGVLNGLNAGCRLMFRLSATICLGERRGWTKKEWALSQSLPAGCRVAKRHSRFSQPPGNEGGTREEKEGEVSKRGGKRKREKYIHIS